MAGLLDGLADIFNYVIKMGKDPAMVFKFVASGVYVKKAFTGGTTMVAWGVLFHYCIYIYHFYFSGFIPK